MQASATPELSIVIPCFNEADAIDALAERLQPILQQCCGEDYEVVLVDDGSQDRTREKIFEWRARNDRVIALMLARNFGKEAALSCGLHFARGRAVVILDADLQDPPELIPDMLKRWKDGADIVLARRISRKSDGWIKRTTARLFYRLMSWLAESMVPPQVGDFRLMDRRVIDALAQLPERTRFMKGLMNYVGFRVETIDYDRPARSAGGSSWSLWRLWNLALDGITSFSTVPLRAWSYLGTVIALIGMSYAGWIVLRTLIYGIDVPGYASLVTMILFFSGLQLISIGILGEYLGRILIETKDRPIYVIDEVEGVDPDWLKSRRERIRANLVLPSERDQSRLRTNPSNETD